LIEEEPLILIPFFPLRCKEKQNLPQKNSSLAASTVQSIFVLIALTKKCFFDKIERGELFGFPKPQKQQLAKNISNIIFVQEYSTKELQSNVFFRRAKSGSANFLEKFMWGVLAGSYPNNSHVLDFLEKKISHFNVMSHLDTGSINSDDYDEDDEDCEYPIYVCFNVTFHGESLL
jgi:hypothetical protein